MNHHRCICHFIPPGVLDSLARGRHAEAREKARRSVIQSKQSRLKRDRREKEVPLAALAATGSTGRIVYDCEQQWIQKVKKVRGEGDPVTGDTAVDEVYEYAGVVRDYYANVLGRNSLDNAGMALILNVHFGVDYMNAFWDGDEMTFGDGDGEVFVSFTKSLDVVAHELTHGVTQFTANLDYYSQSGALNEHFSDALGSAIQQHYKGQTATNADWLIGNEIMGPELFGESLRSMKAPGSAYDNYLIGKDSQPAHMDDYYTGPNDNQGVHHNSGIPNRAFYLVARDIGTDVAALIWFTALQRLWPTAGFNDAVEVIAESARLLIKAKKVPEGATQTVRWAFGEVGLPY